MSKKITWSDIYLDFQRRFPNLSKKAIHYCANGYLSIQVFFDDGSKMNYDYMAQRGQLFVG
ncbi:MAG: hypothetical protein KH921_07175 [Erysipelotrichaceae bacterium]|nr:hypothetical protein [Erysipelotrichaceae bacterium]